MKIKEEKHHQTCLSITYVIDSLVNRESCLRWGVLASNLIAFEKKQIRVEDGESYHDGTISTVYENINDASSFVEKYLYSPIYLIAIFGEYKNAQIAVQIHLNLHEIYIDCEESELHLVEELEQLLGLV